MSRRNNSARRQRRRAQRQQATQQRLARASEPRRPPATDCAGCGTTDDTTRIVANESRTCLVSRDNELRTEGVIWTTDAKQRALGQVESGQHPWLCMRCAGRTCPHCDGLLCRPVACTVLLSDGTTAYHAILAAPVVCMECKRRVGG